MIPQPEYVVFYALHAAAEATRAEWIKWNRRLDRAASMSNADWQLWMRAKDNHEAALAVLAEFCARMEVSHA